MRFCQTICLVVATLIPASVFAQERSAQTQQPSQYQNMMRQAPNEDPVTPPRQRQATVDEVRARQQAITNQQKSLNNPMADQNINYQPQLPQGFPLAAEEEQMVQRILDHWQQQSSQIKRSSSEFTRRSYNAEECAVRDQRNNQLFPFNITLGQIYFAAPDKGRFETQQIWNFTKPPAQAGAEPTYEQLDIENNRERWVCDGRAIYQYDFENKRLNEAKIPKELQGNGLVNSPLPFFLFGADKKLILERYWVRHTTPASATKTLWLEAYPKRVQDARVYKKLEIVISRDDFLPSSLVMYASNYDAKSNPTMQSFEFANRRINSHLDGIRDFFAHFRRPPTPIGWKRVDLSSTAVGQTQNPAENGALKR